MFIPIERLRRVFQIFGNPGTDLRERVGTHQLNLKEHAALMVNMHVGVRKAWKNGEATEVNLLGIRMPEGESLKLFFGGNVDETAAFDDHDAGVGHPFVGSMDSPVE
jgi:hypothetical protein